MSQFYPLTAKEYQTLRDRYEALDSRSRRVVQMASVIYEPLPRATLLSCLNHIGFKASNGKPFTAPAFNDLIMPLFKQGLLESSMMGVSVGAGIVEIATRDAIAQKQFAPMVAAVQHYLPVKSRFVGSTSRYFSSEKQLIREVRICLYQEEGVEALEALFREYYSYGIRGAGLNLADCLYQIVMNPFDRDWLNNIEDAVLYGQILLNVIAQGTTDLVDIQEAIDLLRLEIEEEGEHDEESYLIQKLTYADVLLVRGELPDIESLGDDIGSLAESVGYPLAGAMSLLKGEGDRACTEFKLALTQYRKLMGKRKAYFRVPVGLLHVLALLQVGTPEALKEAEEYAGLARKEKHWLSDTYAAVETFLQIQQGAFNQKNNLLNHAPMIGTNPWEILIKSLCLYWSDRESAVDSLSLTLEDLFHRSRRSGFLWFSLEAAELMARLNEDTPAQAKWQTIADTLREGTDYEPLVDLLQIQSPWEQRLAALTNLTGLKLKSTPSTSGSSRVIWTLTPMGKSYSIQPKEQTMSAKGVWTKGRPIALKRLRSTPQEISSLTEQDLHICRTYIQTESIGYYGKTDYSWNPNAIVGLIGHPLVFFESNLDVLIEVVQGTPELRVTKLRGGKLSIAFSTDLPTYTNVVVEKETPTRLRVMEITPDHRRIQEILGSKNKLEVPESAKERVLEAIGSISSLITVQSDIGGGTAAQMVEALSTPHVHLLPSGEGLRLSILTAPFGTGSTYYRPGTGGETVMAEIDGKRVQTTRNLKEEKKLAQAILKDCPTLQEWESTANEWVIETAAASLEVLVELQALGDRAIVEWPQGEKMRVKNQADFNNLHMKLKSQNDWFQATGELRLPDGSVLEMQNLLRLLDQSTGRFISLGQGEFLALTNEFRRRLEDLRDYSDYHGKGIRFNALATPTIEDWIEDIGELEADQAWREQMERIQSLRDYNPEVPSTLQAELRDYQIEGFTWLARLARWGVGACLADDMGLGKTLQTLAVMLTLAPKGPILAIAPTSVCMNWISEAEKFAPTLNPIQFGSGNRQQVLDELAPFDLMVCSYGLLQQEEVAEMLSKVHWQMIVLDEAQSIKNFATKRSQAAMNLQGDFKLLTTGTPIENHLGELWNLFRFINPGLLGSLDKFNQTYAAAIERGQDKKVRDRLRRLIQPFILRRTKTQVLQELPSRTEIVLNAELSREEMVFYEALRREVIAKLEESDANAGQKHLQVLAEIMRLRRACCNTQLVKPEIAIPSTKLEVFANVLTELLDNQHKALVFSQFVDHLALIRAYLDDQGISYQYLDGSTPVKERKKRVDAFQGGEGDVFLISLKAGGTGLNLTAADYVIHMDPWWNPAVEDQASDRAHRMGQKRPVTIYRIVAQHTIEEKIVQLHQQKRDLADSLLEGTEMSGKISTDDLIRLIQER